MDREQLLALEGVGHLSPAAILVQNPKLGAVITRALVKPALHHLGGQLVRATPEVRRALGEVELSAEALTSTRPLREVLLDDLARKGAAPELRAAVKTALAVVGQPTAGRLLGFDVPVLRHPGFQRELETGRFYRLSDAAGVPPAAAKALLNAGLRLSSIDDEKLQGLVEARTIKASDARTVATAVSLYRALDESTALVAAVRAVAPRVGGPEDLLGLTAEAWRRIVTAPGVTFPRGASVEAYAAALVRKLEALYPARALSQRLATDPDLSRFLADNPDVLSFDLRPGSPQLAALRFATSDAAERRRLLSAARSYQRIYNLTREVAATEQVVKAGYGSALSIARTAPQQFAAETGLQSQVAGQVQTRAKHVAKAVVGRAGTVLDLLRGGFNDTAVGNVSPAASGFLKELPGFADFFGNQDYCACEHCRSIYGPAAYFVDLMTFIDEKVGAVTFSGAKSDHPLNLRVRRPDLWTLPLSCENTNTLISTLEVVNEVLESYIARAAGVADLTDRSAVEQAVYRDALQSAVSSFGQPFHLPLERLKTYLMHFSRSQRDVARATGLTGDTLARVGLSLSPLEYTLVVAANPALPFLRELYGIDFQAAGPGIAPFDAQLLLKRTGLSRDELGELVATRYVTQNGVAPITIKASKQSPESIQNDVEKIEGLTAAALDRMHRFTRLRLAAGLTAGELDLVLTQLGADIGQPALEAIGHLLDAKAALRIGVEEMLALVSPIPTFATTEDGESLLDRVFNLDSFVAAGGSYPQPGTLVLHPAFAETPPAQFDSNLPRLQAGARISADDLNAHLVGLAQPLGLDLAGSEDQKRLALSHDNLSLLYRHARLAKLLRATPAELYQMLALAPGVAAGHVASLDDLRGLRDFHQWWKSTRFSLDDLSVITGTAPRNATAYPDPAAVAAAVVAEVQSEGMLVFAGTVFAFIPGVTEEQSQAVVDANAARIEAVAGAAGYRLAADFDPALPLAVPVGVNAAEGELRTALLAYHSSTLLQTLLPGRLATTPAAFQAALAMLGESLSHPDYMAILRGELALDRLAGVAADALRLAVLFKDGSVFDAVRLAFVQTHGPLFGIFDFRQLSMASIQAVERYRSTLVRWKDDPAAAPDLGGVLAAFTAAQHFAAADQDALAAALGCEIGLSLSLQERIALPADAFGALARLTDAVELAQELGVAGDMLSLAAATDYDEISAAADAVYAAFRAKYEDETEWQAKVEPFQDRILSRRRDGLVAYLLYSSAPEIDEKDDLYHYFLLDVELEGCARTSRIVAANSSLQLYVQRVLMNLEETPPGHAEPVHVLPTAIPAEEWEWRKNYRLWEANRKVFLYPENYIEPELRDDKTPLFEVLEQELLAGEINDDTVRDAYARYMRGFEEVSRLKIAGSFHEKNDAEKQDALHLFGATSDDPPVYYYRRVDNLHYGETEPGRATSFGPWTRIDVQIAARRVAPIVYQGRLYVFWVEIVTKPRTKTRDGDNVLVAYMHKWSVKYVIRRLDGGWTAPQDVKVKGYGWPFDGDGSLINDFLDSTSLRSLYSSKSHEDVDEDYTLTGLRWDRVYPWVMADELILRGADFQVFAALDLYQREIGPRLEYGPTVGVPWVHPMDAIFLQIEGWDFAFPATRILWSQRSDGKRILHAGPAGYTPFEDYTYASVVLHREHYEYYKEFYPIWANDVDDPQWAPQLTDIIDQVFDSAKLLTFPDSRMVELGIVNGSPQDGTIDASGQLFHLAEGLREDDKYLLRRLNTSVTRDVARALFTLGVDELLQTATQLELGEAKLSFTHTNRVHARTHKDELDYEGPMGVYLREIFFHIPALIANHLNAQGDFEGAQRWYHYIFDPTANEVITGLGGLSAEEKKRRELDRNWRYREFRGLDLDTLRAQLTNQVAIEVYKKDPFNPHAIARLRLSAYQKTIVMKYIDNLLDWGDRLFAQDTMESINEATLLYVMAKEILGPRPAQLGDCGQGEAEHTYESIQDHLADDSEFLLELESLIAGPAIPNTVGLLSPTRAFNAARGAYAGFFAQADATPSTAKANPVEKLARELTPAEVTLVAQTSYADLAAAPKAQVAPLSQSAIWKGSVLGLLEEDELPSFGDGLLRQLTPVFCVPHNEELIGYWDRVEDRLFKIRNCLNIEGVRRQLALFAPPISPRLLVRAKAAGLSLDAILAALGSDLPPYRFRFLIERAKSYTGVVQGFGAALLVAIEKRDGEELARLRNLHQRNILSMTTDLRRHDVEIAGETIRGLELRQAAVQYRLDYYAGLLDTGLTASEIVQTAGGLTAAGLETAAGVIETAAAIFYLLPQFGSPFAMKYGGKETGDSGTTWSEILHSAASVARSIAGAAGIAAGFERRDEGWEHQRMLADHELRGILSQLESARVRKLMAEEALHIHETGIEQLDEVMEFFDSKFPNLALYTHLAATLQRLYREAFNAALGFARLAEAAYRFERDEPSVTIGGDYWDASRGGLLAGEKLMSDLVRLERRFFETDYRQPEINQSFSVAQLDPAALMMLKQTGACEFVIPEYAFDLYYPGHYKRRIKAARLTIPCIAGPYTNVGAKLSLVASWVRRKPKLDEEIEEVPRTRTLSVATSTAQGDSGVFDFSFRDERYMPFEGAGAISKWRLELPSSFRPFDYDTISDIILNISYTALDDALLRQAVEDVAAAEEGSLMQILSTESLPRLFSLRQEFSTVFQRLTHSAPGTPVDLDITERHFPLFLQGRELQVATAALVVYPPAGESAAGVALSVNGEAASGLSADPRFGGLPSKTLGMAFAAGLKGKHSLSLTATGDLDPKKLRDLLVYVEYQLA